MNKLTRTITPLLLYISVLPWTWLILAVCPASSQSQHREASGFHMSEKGIKQLEQNEKGQDSMNADAYDAYKKSDNELNRVYKHILIYYGRDKQDADNKLFLDKLQRV